jgi:nicotinate-nucleotide adenylyltransferase
MLEAEAGRAARIGIFGGTFDPPHNAHLALARSALDALRLDRLLWVPAGQPWQKARTITPAAQREAMVALTIAGEPRFAIDRREIERQGPSYTLDTVREIGAEQPGAEFFLIIGQDQYAGLHTWHGWQELLGRVVLAVANRPGVTARVHADVIRHPHRVVPLAMLDIAATDVRAKVARGEALTGLVPVAVERYIDQHHLYAGGAAAH